MTRPDHRFRRAEGSGPWLHPPRKPAPRRFPSLMIWCAAWIVASLLATIAIPAPAPIDPAALIDAACQKGC